VAFVPADPIQRVAVQSAPAAQKRTLLFHLWQQSVVSHLAVHHPVYATAALADPNVTVNDFLVASYS
jgi:hypothetical protein